MRIINVGLMTFLLTGVALSLSGADLLQIGDDRVSDAFTATPLVFESRSLAEHRTGTTRVAIARTGADAPLILSGLPAYGSARFAMPISARPISGYLQLDTTIQALAGVEGVLRVAIDNTRRGEILLAPGTVTRDVRIPLTDADLGKPALNVSFSVVGEGASASCTRQDDLAVVAEVEASSRLILNLATPLQTAADRVVAWGNIARIDWSAALSDEQRANRLAQAATLARAGMPITFATTDGMNDAELEQVVASHKGIDPAGPVGLTFPADLTQLSGNAGARTFKHGTTWRSRFHLNEGDGSETAGRFDIDLTLGPLPADAHWIVSATLNGKLLLAETVQGGARGFQSTLALPHSVQGRTNILEVTAVSSQDLPGLCNDGPDLIAELNAGSVLHGGGQPLSGALDDLRAAMAERGDVTLMAYPGLTAPDATAFARLVGGAVPEDVALRGRVDRADITLLNRAKVATLAGSGMARPDDWLVFASEEYGTLQTLRATPEAMAELARTAPLAILIRLPQRRLAEAAR
ncbi:hypothetical protein [Jannaschia sp. 2305UL9-9]|uniref:hypothetical protein n=1 Tax=Jannaschia sp. 2305UL9-9 TaxID=3121638 RepID=UPI003529470A